MTCSLRQLAFVVGSLIFAVVAIFLAIYLSSLNTGWVGAEHSTPKIFLLVACSLSVYLAVCAARDRVWLMSLFDNRTFTLAFGIFAAIVSVVCLFLVFADFNWGYAVALVTTSLLSAAAFRFGLHYQAFGVFTLLYGVLGGLLSVGPVMYLLNPPGPDPAGGNGINAGIAIVLMAPFISMAILNWIGSLCFEKWTIVWHIAIAILCLPGAAVLLSVVTGMMT